MADAKWPCLPIEISTRGACGNQKIPGLIPSQQFKRRPVCTSCIHNQLTHKLVHILTCHVHIVDHTACFDHSDVHKHGILEVNSERLVTALVEKPKPDQTSSRKAVSE